MASGTLRIGIAGCGYAARVHAERIMALEGVEVVGCADPDLATAEALAAHVAAPPAAAFADHRELIRRLAPDALAVFTPHVHHYRPAMDALQADCHVFIEKPLSTSVQEAVDIVGLARGRGLKVAVGHQYRLRPSVIAARERLAAGAIGPLRLVTGVLCQPWLARHVGAEGSWRLDPKAAGGGILADSGDHLVDALLWTTGRVGRDVAAVQSRLDPGLDLVAVASLSLDDGTPVALAASGVSPGELFDLNYFGEHGRLRLTDQALEEQHGDGPAAAVALPSARETIDGNFVAALRGEAALCCPADGALDAVRLLEAIARSAATRQFVRLA